MTTTTNTTTRKSYDLTAIMGRAWDIRRNAAEEIGCKVSEVIMGECLRIAWAEAEGQHAARNAAERVASWGNMTEAEQVNMMKRCIHRAARNAIGYSTKDHYLQFSEGPAFGLYGPHDLDEFVSETWLRVAAALDPDKLTATNERRAAQGKRPITLISIVYNAARASIAAIFYQDSKHAAATDFEITNDNGEAESYTETRVADLTTNTETSAIIRADLERFKSGRDAMDQAILERVAAGMTEREIAAEVKISNVAVHKRIVKMRAALQSVAC